MGNDTYLDRAFWEECLLCLQNERGKPALPTVQALFLMYLHECGQGRDAIAIHYRYLAHDMYMRLKLDYREPSPEKITSDPAIARDWKGFSVMMWGMYCFDTCVYHPPDVRCPLYSQSSLLILSFKNSRLPLWLHSTDSNASCGEVLCTSRGRT